MMKGVTTIVTNIFLTLSFILPSVFCLTSTSTLLKNYASDIATLKEKASTIVSDPPANDVFYLRYCLAYPDDIDERTSTLASNLEWRNTGHGKKICDAATSALQAATSTEGSFDNTPIRDAAPHASIVNQYITPKQIITTTSPRGDLVYCVRAGKIDDVALMSKLTTEKMVEFFLYCKEVNAQVADQRSLTSDKLVRVILANDLSGVKLVGGDTSFRDSLSAASKESNVLYPELSGATLLLNLPFLVSALVKVFTPLFPPVVRKKIKFEKGVLDEKNDLEDYLLGGKGRGAFDKDIEKLVYKSGDWE